jgi:NAD(P)-dependent dehydrogenase (short-subunit alcohol dehydrogenase family)
MTAMEQRLKNRVAVVTGGARGIGEGIARRLAQEGASVCIADIDEQAARQTAMALIGATYAQVDIADQRSVDALAAKISADYGHVDILVNNAAILDVSVLSGLTFTRFAHVLDVNLNGALRVTLALMPFMTRREHDGGRILNIASVMGFRGSRDSVPYSTAKGGLVNLTRCLACDLAGDRITVNAIAPGFINTRMSLLPDGVGHEHETDWFKDIYIKYGRIPLARAGVPADIAGPAFFFCSDDSQYVTGQVLAVDGGMSATF